MRFYARAVYSIWLVELVSYNMRKLFHEQDLDIYSYRSRCVQSFILQSLHAISWLFFYLINHLSTILSVDRRIVRQHPRKQSLKGMIGFANTLRRIMVSIYDEWMPFDAFAESRVDEKESVGRL